MGLKQVIGSGNPTLDPQNHAARSGVQTRTYQKGYDARPGVQTLDLQKNIVHTNVHMIANTIMHTIIKISVRTKYTNEFHVEHAWWMMDNGQIDGKWTDQPKNGRQTDHSKNDASVKKDMFPAEHIFF